MGKVKFDDIAKESRETFHGNLTDVPIVGLEHIEPHDMLLRDFDTNVDTTFTKSFKAGQILFGRRRAYQQKACVATCDGICSGDITVIEPKGTLVFPDLLPWIIQNDNFFDHAVRGSNGALSPRVKWEHMANFEVNLPSLEEQEKLAEKLWAAYELKQSYIKMIAATDEMVKSRFIEMFKGIDNYVSLPDICRPKQWKTLATKELTKNGYLTYGANGVIGRYSTYNHEYPTIMIGCRGTCGVVNISEPKSYINGNAMALDNLSDAVLLEFLAYYLRQYDFRPIISGGVQPQITGQGLSKVKVPVPTIDEQRIFVTIVKQADKSKFELNNAIKAIDKVIKSLINENI